MIKKATVEKLTNKILRRYHQDLVTLLPFLLLLLLHFGRALDSKCSGRTAWWLLVYFTGVFAYSTLKLVKLAVIRTNSSVHLYFVSWAIIACLYYTCMFAWFVYGLWTIHYEYYICPKEYSEKHGHDPNKVY